MESFNDTDSYKKLHEKFVSDNVGSNVIEIALVCATCPIAVLLRNVFESCLFGIKHIPSWLKFLVDYCFLVIPGVLCATAAESQLQLFLSSLLILAGFILTLNVIFRTDKPKVSWTWTGLMQAPMTGKRPFITAFRSYTNLATAVFILAVDFPVFPRRFCKTESFGTGLMDVGVGGFIVANAIVSPEARGKVAVERSLYGTLRQLWRAARSTLPLWVLGCMRLVSVKAADYHEHTSEYGVHWNFFFTLAVVRVMSTLALCVVRADRSWLVAVVLAGVYQNTLSTTGLKDYILRGSDGRGSREGLLNANREGIFSCFGYLAIYFASVQIGRFLRQPRSRFVDWLKAFVVLVGLSAGLWMLLAACGVFDQQVSRRMANLPFVIWMLAHQTTFLCGFFLADLLITTCNHTILLPPRHASSACLLEAVNRNGLLFFMLANLMTGVVNMSLATILAPPLTAYSVLIGYMLILSLIATLLHRHGVTVKFW